MPNYKYCFYHGAAIIRILQDERCKSVEDYFDQDNSSYIVSGKYGIYIKYSEKRMSPWSFNFQDRHRKKILELFSKYDKCFILLVCSDIGVCCLNKTDLHRVIDLGGGSNFPKTISISKRKREKYKISGTDGDLKYKIGDNDFPDKIFVAPCYER